MWSYDENPEGVDLITYRYIFRRTNNRLLAFNITKLINLYSRIKRHKYSTAQDLKADTGIFTDKEAETIFEMISEKSAIDNLFDFMYRKSGSFGDNTKDVINDFAEHDPDHNIYKLCIDCMMNAVSFYGRDIDSTEFDEITKHGVLTWIFTYTYIVLLASEDFKKTFIESFLFLPFLVVEFNDISTASYESLLNKVQENYDDSTYIAFKDAIPDLN